MPPPGLALHELPFCHPTCDAYALDDAGVDGFEGSDKVQCAVFYASGCALYRDLFLDLASLGAPPTPPPPPMRPLAGQRLLQPIRIFFAGGLSDNMASSSTGSQGGSALDEELLPYRSRERMRRELQDVEYEDTTEILDASDDPVVLDACVNGTWEAPTLCETQGDENAWITFDLGETVALYAVAIGLYPHPVSPPAPPLPRPTPPPSLPPGTPPAPPSSPGDSSTSQPGDAPCVANIQDSTCWHNLIKRTDNGICEDGAEGSESALCEYGTDYPDCPARCPMPSPPPPSPPPPSPPPSSPPPSQPPSLPPFLNDFVECGSYIQTCPGETTVSVTCDSGDTLVDAIQIELMERIGEDPATTIRGTMAMDEVNIYGTSSSVTNGQITNHESDWSSCNFYVDDSTLAPWLYNAQFADYCCQGQDDYNWCMGGFLCTSSPPTIATCPHQYTSFVGTLAERALVQRVDVQPRAGLEVASCPFRVYYRPAADQSPLSGRRLQQTPSLPCDYFVVTSYEHFCDETIYANTAADTPLSQGECQSFFDSLVAAGEYVDDHEMYVYSFTGIPSGCFLTLGPENANTGKRLIAINFNQWDGLGAVYAQTPDMFRVCRCLEGSWPPISPPGPPPSSPPSPPPPSPPPPKTPADGLGDDAENGGFEIWYSDVSSFFGTRARTVLNGVGHLPLQNVYRIDKDERGDDATGRYVSLRIFHPHKRLRIDWMRVYGVEASSSRRLFATSQDNVSTENAARDAPELVRGVGEEPAQDERRGAHEDDANEHERQADPVPYADEGGWWHLIEVHHRPDDGWLYARRAPPGAHGVSAAGSLGLAVALAEARETEVPVAYHGHAVTMDAMCAWLSSKLGCHRGDHWSLLYNRQVAMEADEPTATDDDADWATQLLSEAIEPVVYVLVEDSLRCAACSENDWGVDGLICSSCDPTLRGGRGDYQKALRLVEAKIGGGGTHKSRSVPDCVSSLACLGEVASEVAVDMGAATAMPPSSRLEAIAEANELLFAGAVVDFASSDGNGREALLRTHRAEIKRLVEPPNERPAWTQVPPAGYGSNGRRLEEQEDETDTEPTTMTATEYAMHLQTNHTCYMIVVAENRSAALASHAIATQLWLQMDAGGNGPKNSGDICVDCQHPNTTHACRAHFALVGRMLTRMLVREELAAKRAAEEAYAHSEGAHHKRVLEEHVRKTLGESCCARFPDGSEQCGERFCELHVHKTARTRVATVVRRLHEAGHPKAAEMGGAGLQVGIDVVAPELHPDPACRDRAQRHPKNQSGPTDIECLGRSALHHLTKAHGLSSEALKGHVDKLASSGMAETLLGTARAMGLFSEKTSGGGAKTRSAYEKQTVQDGMRANELLEASRRRTEAKAPLHFGRKLEERHYEGRDMGHHAAQAGVAHHHLHRSHRILHAGLRRLDLQVTRATNRQLRAERQHGQPRPEPPSPDELNSLRDLRSHTMPPLTALLALQAEEGSLSSRFGGGLSALGTLRDRAVVAMDAMREHGVAQRRAQEERRERRRRKLAERPADPHKIYDYLESRQAERSNAGYGRHHRQLDEGFLPPEEQPRILELPESHALSWVHELVGDWDSVFDEATRLREVVTRRLEARRLGASHIESVRKHKTGIAWLDNERYNQPSVMGEAMRRLWHRAAHRGEDPPWHHRSVGERVHRRLDARKHGKLRRLAEAFFEGTIAAPFAFWDTLLPSGTVIEGSRVTFWEATLRYLLSSTIGCYFVKPTLERSDTQGGETGDQGEDGDAVKVFRPSAEKLCFPAIPFLLPMMQPFRIATNTETVDLESLSYQEFCTRDGYMQMAAREIDKYGFDARSNNSLLPNAGILRGAEAVDAVLNAARSGKAGKTETESAGEILCAITQLGGVIYVLFVLLVATVLLSFLPVVNFFFMLCFDTASAGVAIAARNPNLKTNTAASGGRTVVGDKLLAGASSLASAAQRNRIRLPRRRSRATGGVVAGSSESETGSLLRDAHEDGIAAQRGLGHYSSGGARALQMLRRGWAPMGMPPNTSASPPTPPITPEGIDVHVDPQHPDTNEAYQSLSRYGVRVEHGTPLVQS